MSAGLERRYTVRKINDPEGKHDACRYFVLDPQHDPIAREALRHYASLVRPLALAADLDAWLNEITEADQ